MCELCSALVMELRLAIFVDGAKPQPAVALAKFVNFGPETIGEQRVGWWNHGNPHFLCSGAVLTGGPAYFTYPARVKPCILHLSCVWFARTCYLRYRQITVRLPDCC